MNLKSFIYSVLNKDFRGFKCLDVSCFPPDEFDRHESEQLALFCRNIRLHGYDSLETHLHEKQFLEVLDEAAEYGEFVDACIGPAYLGVFIAAQLLMEPFGTEGFSRSMVRSEVFRAAPKHLQDEAQFLMVLATLWPEKILMKSDDEYFGSIGVDLRQLSLKTLDVSAVLQALCRDMSSTEGAPGSGPAD